MEQRTAQQHELLNHEEEHRSARVEALKLVSKNSDQIGNGESNYSKKLAFLKKQTHSLGYMPFGFEYAFPKPWRS